MRVEVPDDTTMLEIREEAERAGLVLITDGRDLAYTLPHHIPLGWRRFALVDKTPAAPGGAWVIQRTAPQQQTSFWGRNDRWVLRVPMQRTAELGKFRVPECAARFSSYDAAHDVARWLRDNQPLCHGEVIAVITEPAR